MTNRWHLLNLTGRSRLPMLRQTEDEHRQNHRVVDAQHAFEGDEQRDRDEIRRMDHSDAV